jgi:lysophospholipase L1-like esterase
VGVLTFGALLFKPLLFTLFEAVRPLLFDSDLVTTPDSRFGMDLRPNLRHARLVAPARPHDPSVSRQGRTSGVKRRLTFYADTNAFGLRGPETTLEPPPGGFRVACVGDSITFGWGVTEAESYAGLLQSRLSDALPGRRVEVLNAGVPGFRFQQLADRIRYKLAPFRPDVIVVLKMGDLQVPDPMNAYRRELYRIIDESARTGARLILALPPISSFDVRPESRRFAALLDQVGRERSIPTFDFTPLFQARGSGRGIKLVVRDGEQQVVRYEGEKATVLFRTPAPPGEPRIAPALYDFLDTIQDSEALIFDGGHPDVEGNRLIAATLVEIMKSHGWLEPPGSNAQHTAGR